MEAIETLLTLSTCMTIKYFSSIRHRNTNNNKRFKCKQKRANAIHLQIKHYTFLNKNWENAIFF